MDAIVVASLSPLTSLAHQRPRHHHPCHHVVHPCPTIVYRRPHSHQYRQVHVTSWSPSPSRSHILASPLSSPCLCVPNPSRNGACLRSCHVTSPSCHLTTIALPSCEWEHILTVALTHLLSLLPPSLSTSPGNAQQVLPSLSPSITVTLVPSACRSNGTMHELLRAP